MNEVRYWKKVLKNPTKKDVKAFSKAVEKFKMKHPNWRDYIH